MLGGVSGWEGDLAWLVAGEASGVCKVSGLLTSSESPNLWSTEKKIFIGNVSRLTLSGANLSEEETGVEVGTCLWKCPQLSHVKIRRGRTRLKQILS